jgi:hypothetical protein
MIALGPHIIIHRADDGNEQEIHVTINFLGQETVKLSKSDYILETGEVCLEFVDWESRFPVSGSNTLSLVGNAIMIAEAYLEGICEREGGQVYRHMLGDVKKPGDMFR